MQTSPENVPDGRPAPIPPPDCYPAHTCKPTSAPKSLQQHYRNTNPVLNNESLPEICKQDRCVTETYDSKQGLVNGTQPAPSAIVALQDLEDGRCNPMPASVTRNE
jgi:hypothetical protein